MTSNTSPARFCCVKLQTAVICVGIISAISSLLHITVLLVGKDAALKHVSSDWLNLSVVGFFLLMVASCLLIAAVYTKKRWLLLPYGILGLIFAFSQLVIVVGTLCYHFTDLIGNGAILAFFLTTLLSLLINIWILWVVWAYYKHLGLGYSHISESGGAEYRASDVLLFTKDKSDNETNEEKKPTIVSKLMKKYYD